MPRILALLLVAVITVACGCRESSPKEEKRVEEKEPPAGPAPLSAPSPEQIAAAKEAGRVPVTLETEKGVIALELDGAAAPVAVANFVNLVNAGFYDGMPFHRVEPGFVIQAGNPTLMNRPPVGYTIPDERSPIKHRRGTIAMARLFSGGQMVPNSGSTQFYICLGEAPHLDSMGFTAFGHVVEGLDVIERVAVGDRIEKATVRALPPNRVP